MKLIFLGGGETATFYIDRKKKELIVSSAKTNYKPVKTEWKNLFDRGKEEQQEKITDTLSDQLFIRSIEEAMRNYGYKLIQSKC